MAKVSTKRLLAEIKEIESNGIDYPKHTPEFDNLRSKIYSMLEEGTRYTSNAPKLTYVPEETIYNRGEDRVGGFFRYARVISVRLPEELGVDSAEINAVYYIDPLKGMEAEINRVINSINAVEKWSEKTITDIQTRELANRLIEAHKNGRE